MQDPGRQLGAAAGLSFLGEYYRDVASFNASTRICPMSEVTFAEKAEQLKRMMEERQAGVCREPQAHRQLIDRLRSVGRTIG